VADEGTSLTDFTFIRKLGQGGFSKVLLTKRKLAGQFQGQELCAVNVLKKETVIRGNCASFVMIEKDVLTLVRGHPFIISLYSCFRTEVIFLNFKSVS
jgi:serine/threonine protein kinase